MASSDPPPPTSSPAAQHPLADITYKLVYQRIKGEKLCECSNSTDHVRIKPGRASRLNPRLPSDSELTVYRAHFAWAKYSGEVRGYYDRVGDTFTGTESLGETFEKDAGAKRATAEIKITPFKERNKDWTLVENGGRYLRVDVKFAGSPAHSAKIWGKRVAGNDVSGAVQLSKEEKVGLGIEGKKRTWNTD